MKNKNLELDAFVRAISVNKGIKHSILLGAGASITSGIPSAENCIWEWKRAIFLSNNPTLEKQFAELSLESVRNRIQEWLDRKQEYPKLGSVDEYGFYIEACYRSVENRRKYFEEKIRHARPHVGYQLLCLLAEAELIDVVWTTNFDSLVSRAAANFKLTPIEIGIDTQERLLRTPSKGELPSVSLHGDYRYDKLKNTLQEIQFQEQKLINGLTTQIIDKPLIVCGYSGRDKSIMDALKDAYSQKGQGTLYWCGFGSSITPNVEQLIAIAIENGHEAYFIPTQGFDDLMTRLSLFCLSGEMQERCQSIIAAKKFTKDIPGKFSVPESLRPSGLVKSNAFSVEIPSDVFEIDIKNWKRDIWGWLDSITKNTDVVAVPYRHKILCLGSLKDIKNVFNDHISNEVIRVPIGDQDLRDDTSVVISLLRNAIVRTLAAACKLPTDGRRLIWEDTFEKRQEASITCLIHKSVLLYLRKVGSKMCLVLKPSIYITDSNNVEVDKEVSKIIKIKVLGWQHNKEFNQEIDDWKNKLLGSSIGSSFEFPPNSGSDFHFSIQKTPFYAEIREKTNSIISIDKWRNVIQHTGFVVDEPDLLFSSKKDTVEVKDPHPLHGLTHNNPYDYSINQTGFPTQINLGVICPDASSLALEKFLFTAQQSFMPNETDYLVEYPGFTKAFGVGLEIPKKGNLGWQIVPEVPNDIDLRAGALKLAHSITTAIDSLVASHKPNLVIVFIPERWRLWRKFQSDDESFDLHDFVKAYCVQRGVATQFLEEQTLSDTLKCRVWWWLAVALYSKAMRTPWVLDNLDVNTAFVGLGFSLKHHAEKGKQIVLGCSHIYNSLGEGLKFRLSKIQNPVWINRNPYMSKDDARQVGETIRSLFFESRSKLPDRVVIHKLTPFKDEERDGLINGLNGVREVDMIELSIDFNLRYMASRYYRNEFQIDGFPVRRGTVIPIDDYSALMWVHGSTDSIKPGRKYFQGGRRIPAPIIIRRYAGKSELSTLANEILGLSKMDWNSGDMYTKLPVTVFSSQRIAKIGSLLQRFEPTSYDYRLFI